MIPSKSEGGKKKGGGGFSQDLLDDECLDWGVCNSRVM